MFDFDVGKLLIFGIVALAVIPPKDLPRVMRTVGQTIGKMRRMAAEFQGQFMDAMKEADLDSVKQDLENVKKELSALEQSAKVNSSFDPAMAMRQEVTQAVEGPKDVGHSEVALNEPVGDIGMAPGDTPALESPGEGEARAAEPEPTPEHAAAHSETQALVAEVQVLETQVHALEAKVLENRETQAALHDEPQAARGAAE